MNKAIYRGIRTNNLKNLDLDIPKNSLICIAGCSGSGKSSLAFDTIYAISDSEYKILTSDNFISSKYEIDFYDFICASVGLKQLNFNLNPRSTIISYFGFSNFLNLAFSRILKGKIKNIITLNSQNICRKCLGLGYELIPDLKKIVDENLLLKDNPFLPWKNSYSDFYTKLLNLHLKDLNINNDSKFFDINETDQNKLLNCLGDIKYKIKVQDNLSGFSLINFNRI